MPVSWKSRLARILSFFAIALTLLLPACAPAAVESAQSTASERAAPQAALTETFTQALALAQATLAAPTATITPSPSPTATETTAPTTTPTPNLTPPALPGVFTTDILDKNALPQTYVDDTCAYLKARWDPNNSPPGTVVMILMYHSVTEDSNPLLPDGSQVHNKDVVMMFEHARELGFETITVAQLADFLDHNARIPARSLLIIVDDRKRQAFYETHFIPHLREYGWTLTNAWISAKDTPQYLIDENRAVIDAGWVDPQSHGVVHNTPIGEYSSDEYILGELEGSTAFIQEHFGRTPLGFIWPGGGFTKRAAELAREAGYRVGFTTNPRGPVMYNWVPLADKVDPAHTFWMPEIGAGDPRMTLPRYWSSDAAYRLDDVANIGEQAAAAAQATKADELAYYDILCKNITGPIPSAAP